MIPLSLEEHWLQHIHNILAAVASDQTKNDGLEKCQVCVDAIVVLETQEPLHQSG